MGKVLSITYLYNLVLFLSNIFINFISTSLVFFRISFFFLRIKKNKLSQLKEKKNLDIIIAYS